MTEQERPEDQLSPESSTEEKKTAKKATKKNRKKPIRQSAPKPKAEDSMIGATLSLNYAKRAFFGIGNIVLNKSNPTFVVPDTFTENEQEVLKDNIRRDILVYGDTPKPGVTKKAEVLDKYIDALKSARMVNRDLHPVINELARKREDGKYTIHEILEHMLQYEVEHENRQAFVEYLNYAMSKIPGPTSVTWTPPQASTNDTSVPAATPSEGYTSEAKGML